MLTNFYNLLVASKLLERLVANQSTENAEIESDDGSAQVAAAATV